MDHAWVKFAENPLLIGTLATLFGGILLALLKLVMERCCHPRADASPVPTPGIAEPGDIQPLAHASALQDVEMGTLSGAETAEGHLSDDVGANKSILHPRDDGGLRGRNEDMANGLTIHGTYAPAAEVTCSSPQPLTNGNVSGVVDRW